jgi:hypothetical protein
MWIPKQFVLALTSFYWQKLCCHYTCIFCAEIQQNEHLLCYRIIHLSVKSPQRFVRTVLTWYLLWQRISFLSTTDWVNILKGQRLLNWQMIHPISYWLLNRITRFVKVVICIDLYICNIVKYNGVSMAEWLTFVCLFHITPFPNSISVI